MTEDQLIADAVRRAATLLEIDPGVLASVIGPADEQLDEVRRLRALLLIRLYAAAEVLFAEQAPAWLRLPNTVLGASPLDLIRRGDLLNAVEYLESRTSCR